MRTALVCARKIQLFETLRQSGKEIEVSQLGAAKSKNDGVRTGECQSGITNKPQGESPHNIRGVMS
jgi:hypothetical protein